MKVLFTTEDAEDLEMILNNMAQNYPRAIKPFRQRVRSVVTRIGTWPLSAQEVAERPGVHVVPMVRCPYKRFYRVEGDSVDILHIAHAARRDPPL